MLAPDGEGGCEGLLHVAHRLLLGRLLDERAAQVDVLRRAHLHHVLEQLRVRAALLQQRAHVGLARDAQRLLARDERQRAGEGLRHQLRRLLHPRLIGLHGKVFEHELAGRDASDRDRALHDRLDDLANGAVDGHRHDALELRLLGKEREPGVDVKVGRQVRDHGLIRQGVEAHVARRRHRRELRHRGRRLACRLLLLLRLALGELACLLLRLLLGLRLRLLLLGLLLLREHRVRLVRKREGRGTRARRRRRLAVPEGADAARLPE